MELREAMETRRSIRGFTGRQVSKEVLQKVLALAARSVSALNAQPWEFVVVTGELLRKIALDNQACFEAGEPETVEDPKLEGVYRERMIGIAKQLFAAMDIPREDKERRLWWSKRGFRFFDAPAVILLTMDASLDEKAHRFDLGAVAQSITLAAMEYGLGTCVEQQAVNYQRGLRRYLDVPESKRYVIGIAIGYPDEEFPANHVRSERVDPESITSWYGFD
ncbi:MAG: nitroreductase [Eubacteriales bacterium]|jgi:nitroreductase|nr:nitroreductase [Eubacteriales bacterium]